MHRLATARRMLRAVILELGRLKRLVRTEPSAASQVGSDVQVHAASDLDFAVGRPVDLLLYLADGPENLYQFRQWEPVLEELAGRCSVAVLCRSAKMYLLLREQTSLPLLYVRYLRDLEAVYLASDVKVCLYVNNHPNNFHSLTFADQLHVHLNHGESDKISMASNQAKAYDYVVIAGQAARERYELNLLRAHHASLLELGRPQIDLLPSHRPRPDGRACVVYAPTWEGGREHMDYTSVAEFGERMVRTLIDADVTVIYRPHPKTGTRRGDVGDADRRIRALIASRPDTDGHRLASDAPIGDVFAEADVLIADVSSVPLDFLPTGRPFLITRPATAPGAPVASSSEVDRAAIRLHAEDVAGLPGTVARLRRYDAGRDERLALVERFFGDITPGVPMRRFADGMAAIVAERDRLVADKRRRLTVAGADAASSSID